VQTFPIFLNLHGRKALVVGDGEAAARKAEALQRAGADLRTAPRFRPTLLDGCAIAIGADAPDADLEALSAAAQSRGIPVNIVDCPALCSYITPSVIDRDPVTIAVSSGGAAPVLARLLRAKIEASIAPAYGKLAALADRFKADIRQQWPDLAQRRRMLERALGGRVADLALAGQDAAAEAEMRRAIASAPEPSGIVYLVGAGPGAADLLTLRAQRLLGEADVIVHDRLVSPEVLDMARRDADRIDVGKSAACHTLPQAEIAALMVRLGREGRKVVRLKGGDPLVFGRAAEELAALQAAGIPFEIVPGITAALACAASAAIPLTDGARTLTLATGHTGDLPFEALVHTGGMIACYMGLHALPRLRDGFLAAGLDPAAPCTLIQNGGTSAQRALCGTLAELSERAPEWSADGPTLLLVRPAQ